MEEKIYCIKYWSNKLHHFVYTVDQDGAYYRYEDQVPKSRLLTRSAATALKNRLSSFCDDPDVYEVYYSGENPNEKAYCVKYWSNKLHHFVYTVDQDGAYYRYEDQVPKSKLLTRTAATALEDKLRPTCDDPSAYRVYESNENPNDKAYCVQYWNDRLGKFVYTVDQDGAFYREESDIPKSRLLTRSAATALEDKLRGTFDTQGVTRVY